jgi:hypothetical protein
MKSPPEPWYAHEFPDRPLVEGAWLYWPICIHCGPVSHVSFARPALLGDRPRRLSQKARTAAEVSRLARETLLADVAEMLDRKRCAEPRPQPDRWNGLHVVADDDDLEPV